MIEPILVGDIGGTNLRLALAQGGALVSPFQAPCNDFTDPYDAIGTYLGKVGASPRAAVLGVTGPIVDGDANQANNGWRFSRARLAGLGFSDARLVNDFCALAMALPHIPAEGLIPIGEPPTGEPGGTMAVMGPGTGLGVAALIRTSRGDVPAPGEGGHVGFAPADRLEAQVAAHLAGKVDRLCLETVLSGSGLSRLHGALAVIDSRPAADLPPAAITEAALAGDAAAGRTTGLFLDILASAAGDFALLYGARGGVFIGGGVAQRLAPLIDPARFRERFQRKGSRGDFLARIPVRLITDPLAALRGAAMIGAG